MVTGQVSGPPPGRDWDAIRNAYTGTRVSVREIARAHAVTHPAVLKRAKAQGWVRPVADLSADPREGCRPRKDRTPAAARMAQHRKEARAGMVWLRICVHENRCVDALIAAGLIADDAENDPASDLDKLARAIERDLEGRHNLPPARPVSGNRKKKLFARTPGYMPGSE